MFAARESGSACPLLVVSHCSLLLVKPPVPEYPRRRAESLEYIQRVPDRIGESFFDLRHHRMTRGPEPPQAPSRSRGFEEEFADFLEKEDGAVGRLLHEFSPPCSFMAGGSVAEREQFQPRNGL